MFAALCPEHIYILENDTLDTIKHISLDSSLRVGAAFNANSTLFVTFQESVVTVWDPANEFELIKRVDIGMTIHSSCNIIFLRTVDELLFPIHTKLARFNIESETVSTLMPLTNYYHMCLSLDDQRLVIGHPEQISVFTLEGMANILNFPCTSLSKMAATNCFERLIVASYGGMITVFDLNTGETIAQRRLETAILNVGFGVFQHSFYVRVKGKFTLLRVADLIDEHSIVCTQCLESSAFDPVNNRILISHAAGEIEQRDGETGEVLRVAVVHQKSCFRIIVAPQAGFVLM